VYFSYNPISNKIIYLEQINKKNKNVYICMLDNWQYDGKSLRKIDLTNREKQFVLGTLLGNGSIIMPKNSLSPHLQIRESINKGGNWLRCKAEELKRFSRQKSFISDKDSFRWNSITNECWRYYFELCYKNKKKKITLEWLDQLQDIGITAWFIDKGQIFANHCHIRVSRLCKDSLETLQEYFQIIEIPCSLKKHGGSMVVHFEKKETEKLIRLIGPCFPNYLKS